MAPKRKGGTPKQEASKKKKAPAKSTAKKRPAPASAAQVKTEAPTSAPSTKKAKAPKKVKAEAPPPPPPPPPAPPTIAFGSGAARQPHRAGEPRAGNRPGVSRPFGLHRVDAADRAALAWEGELSGVLSAQCMAEDAEPCRLLGTSLVAFDVAAGGDAGRELRDLCRAVNPTAKATRTHYGVERFNADGEPGKDKDEATTTVKRLLDKVRQGKLLARAAAAVPFLEAAHGLMAPAHLPHKAPCLRCVCVAARGAGGLDVEVRVYATRLLFYLIADDAVKAVLNHIAPAGAVLRREAPPPTADLFVTSGAAAAAPFTLEGVMRSAEHCGGPEDAQPAEIALPMKPYQLMALRWMRSMEELDRGLNGLFWERRDFVDGGCFYYAPDLGEARLEAPPTVHGGLLSDEMGMGKTLEMLSLVCARPATAAALAAADLAADEREAPDDGAAKPLAASRATLLVLPPALVSQWLDEIRKSTVAPGPRVACFVTDEDRKALVPERCDLRGAGGKKATKREFFVQRRAALERLADHDVVVTTYNALTGPVYDKRRGANNGDAQPLSQIHWHRVVLDEMQMVSSPNTVLARTCADLWASSRWMVSGTPLCDGILDLNGELRFLGVYPFSLSDASDGFWHHCVQRPWDLRDPAALERLELLLRTVAMRHSKGQVYASGDLEGRPILELPSRSDGVVAVDVGESSEAVVLRALGAVAGAVVDQLPAPGAGAAAGSGDKAASAVRERALRVLRHACVGLAGKRGAAAPALTDAKDVDELLRFYNRNVRGVHAGADGQSAGLLQYAPPVVSAGEAIARLAAADRNAGDRRRDRARAEGAGARQREADRWARLREENLRKYDGDPAFAARCDGIYGDREAYDDYLTSRIGREDAFAVGDAHAVAAGGAAGRARASERTLTMLTIQQRLDEVRGLAAELEQSRRDSKARARRAALLWTLARFALGHGDDFLVSDLADADGFDDAARAFALRRRRRACAAFVVERALPGAEVARALARRGAEDLPLLERFAALDDDVDGGGAVAAVGLLTKEVGWKKARDATREAADEVAANALKLVAVRQLALRVEASARDCRRRRDAAQEAAATAHAAVAADEAAHGAAGGDDRASLLAVAKAADAAAERAAEGTDRRGEAATAASAADAAKAALVAARSGDADDSLAVLEDRALAGARAGRLAERDYLRALEEMGEDATPAQKRAVDELARAHAPEHTPEIVALLGKYAKNGPPAVQKPRKWTALSADAKKARGGDRAAYERDTAAAYDAAKRVADEQRAVWRPVHQAYVERRAALLATFPVEARAFFANRGSAAGAIKVQLSARVAQQGLKDLARLEEERSPPETKCPVCYTTCDSSPAAAPSARSLCYTGCVHATCYGCAQQLVLTGGVDQAVRRGVQRDDALRLADEGRLEGNCALCRKGFVLRDCVLVRRPARAEAPADDGAAPAAAAPAPAGEAPDPRRPPEWTPCGDADLDALELPRGGPARLANRHLTPNIPNALGAHLEAAREVPSAKIARLLRDIDAAIRGKVNEKVVVVTSIKPAVRHVSLALDRAGLRHVTLSRGDSAAALSAAVREWRERDDCAVFVLHAGAAAAGLTLTAAAHLFLLEPFLSVGEEAQAMNRCHRIGQQRDVRTTAYYLRGTVEERLLAYRAQGAAGDGDATTALSVLATGGDATKMPHHKLRYVAGLAAHAADDDDDDDGDDY